MKIAFAASEAFPFAKTGGLADVVGALPKELMKMGHETKVFIPNYSKIDHSKYWMIPVSSVGDIHVRVAGNVHKVRLFMSHLPESDVEIYFVDAPHYFQRDEIYGSGDEDERFILFAKAVIESLQRLEWIPDVIHCNDWHTGLIPLYIKDNYSWDKAFSKTATMMTIHNIGYQGRFPKDTLYKAEIGEELYYENSPVEVWGGEVCFLKTGLMFADVLTTVSETYAEEIKTPEFGEGLEGVLKYRSNDLYGVVNGVDYKIWNPETDRLIPFNYTKEDLRGKAADKQYLLNAVELDYKSSLPLIGMVSRMAHQKGFDIFSGAIDELMKIPAQWVVLGSGEAEYEHTFRWLASAFKDKFYTYIGYNDELAHLVEAASDIFLMPSRYEPCGLNQIYSLKYGTVPVVRETGGLADTVQDWDEYKHEQSGTGFSFSHYTSEALTHAVKRAVTSYNNFDVWRKLISNGMSKDYSWKVSAEKYIELYKKAVSNRTG